MEVLIVTGMSGAGKSNVINALEDIGYFCVDNLPPELLSAFLENENDENDPDKKIAVVIDSRIGEKFSKLPGKIDDLIARHYNIKLLFIDCDDEVLIYRYKETRRKHPLASVYNDSVVEAIRGERALLAPVRKYATYVIDSTNTSLIQFREKIKETFLEKAEDSISIHVVSFGYKYGIPRDSDVVFDVRCIPNPFYIPELKYKTGLDEEVYDYVFNCVETQELLPKLYDLLDYLMPLYRREGKSQLVIGFGCTGGKHRSVTYARLISEYAKEKGWKVTVNHRDVQK